MFLGGVLTGVALAYGFAWFIGTRYKRQVRTHLDQLDSRKRAAEYAESRARAAEGSLPAQALAARQRAAHRQDTGSTPAVPPAL